MPTAYTPAAEEVHERVARLVEQYHEPLKKAGVTFSLLMAENDGGTPLVLRGQACAAIARKVPLKERVKGCPDVEICIDEKQYEEMGEDEKDALLDHEIYHFMVKTDSDEIVKRDSHGRPQIEMRKHDIEFGWFSKIAERHGIASMEVKQAVHVHQRHGKVLFGSIPTQHLLNFDAPAIDDKAPEA